MIDDIILKEILEKELEKYTANAVFDDEFECISQRNAFMEGFRAACRNVDKLLINSKLWQKKSRRIEDLVENYFEDNDESISEAYTFLYSNRTSISLNYDFDKN